MSPGVALALRAHQERRQAELSRDLAKRDLDAAAWGLADAEADLAKHIAQETFLKGALSDDEQAELLLKYLTSP
ncbi:hypothetical protein [Acidovorax sp.]|uniref:hypothetical protein n=1 Tax=Acidovorax sp. TaxID=1872122 RepID=UPI00391F915E